MTNKTDRPDPEVWAHEAFAAILRVRKKWVRVLNEDVDPDNRQDRADAKRLLRLLERRGLVPKIPDSFRAFDAFGRIHPARMG